jgi:hypothetical protein
MRNNTQKLAKDLGINVWCKTMFHHTKK